MLIPQAEEITGDHQCGFRRKRLISDHIFCINQILEKKKAERNEAVHQLFTDLKKYYESVRSEVLCNILIEYGVPMKLVKLIQMLLSEANSRVRLGRPDTFRMKNGLKQGNCLLPLIFKLV
jgi:hypothetical protein